MIWNGHHCNQALMKEQILFILNILTKKFIMETNPQKLKFFAKKSENLMVVHFCRGFIITKIVDVVVAKND